jgi:hypothetical protein
VGISWTAQQDLEKQESPLTRLLVRVGLLKMKCCVNKPYLTIASMPINLISFYVSAAQDQTLRQDVTKKDEDELGSPHIYIDPQATSRQATHDRLLSPAPVPAPAYRSTTKDNKDSYDSSVSSGSY